MSKQYQLVGNSSKYCRISLRWESKQLKGRQRQMSN